MKREREGATGGRRGASTVFVPDGARRARDGTCRAIRSVRHGVAALLLGTAALLSSAVATATDPSVPPAFPVTVTDDRGVRARIDEPPARIVSLLPSLTETVCALGACDRLVGVDRFSDWPASVSALPTLGGMEDVQVERLYALRPDLVLAAESTRLLERLESLGLTVVALEPRSLADLRRVVTLLGELLALPDAASALLARVELERAAAAARVPPGWRGARAYFEIAATPYAAGEASFIGELLAGLGLDNVVPAALGPFPKLNPEYVVRERPALVLGSIDGVEGMAARPGWGALEALRRGQVCAFGRRQMDVLVRPGPRLGEAANLLADCLSALPSPVARDPVP